MNRALICALALCIPTMAGAAPGIINGDDATVDDFPMTGGMVMDAYLQSPFGSGNIRTFVCSSTLIAPDVVLLAGHCLSEDAFTMGYGSMDINDIGWTRQADLTSIDGQNPNAQFPADTVFAKDWVVHPQFNINTMQVGLADNHDIALLFLEEPILDIEPAYLPTAEEAAELAEGDAVTIVGWGQQIATSMWESPPSGSYAIKQMGDSFIAQISPFEMQIGATESDVRKCHGDSGGPTFYDLEATDTLTPTRLIGVTSHAYDQTDCNTKGGVDTRVDHHLDWIDQELRAACDDGTRVWCDEPGILPAPVKGAGVACGCNAAPTAPALGFWGIGLLGLLGLRRRRD